MLGNRCSVNSIAPIGENTSAAVIGADSRDVSSRRDVASGTVLAGAEVSTAMLSSAASGAESVTEGVGAGGVCVAGFDVTRTDGATRSRRATATDLVGVGTTTTELGIGVAVGVGLTVDASLPMDAGFPVDAGSSGGGVATCTTLGDVRCAVDGLRGFSITGAVAVTAAVRGAVFATGAGGATRAASLGVAGREEPAAPALADDAGAGGAAGVACANISVSSPSFARSCATRPAYEEWRSTRLNCAR